MAEYETSIARLIRPMTISGAALASTNVLETPPAAYNAGTTYSAGQNVSVFSGVNSTTATMYESLQAGNTGNTPSSSPLWWRPIGTTYLAYNPATAYSIGARVTDTTNHQLYEAIQAGTGQALTNGAYWVNIAPSNKWAMFDQKVGTQTIRPLSVSVSIQATGRADSIALFNVDASSVNITVMDGATEVYNEDYSMISDFGIIDWFEYYFEPVVRRTELSVSDLPNVEDPLIIITATDGGDVAIGNCVVGLSIQIGWTLLGASVGITDYSRKTVDDFGNYSITPRAFSRNGRFSIAMEYGRFDQIASLLAQYRATPIVFIGSSAYGAMMIYGFAKDWRLEVPYVQNPVASLEMEGL